MITHGRKSSIRYRFIFYYNNQDVGFVDEYIDSTLKKLKAEVASHMKGTHLIIDITLEP